MAQYDLSFGEKLAETAALVAKDGVEELDAKRTVLYLSLLSSEITLKALLEKAGKPVAEIKARSHNLKGLLHDLGACKIQVEVSPGIIKLCSAVRLRGVVIDPNFSNATVGTLLDAQDAGASEYPNQVRYGDTLKHYPPEQVANMALAVAAWARQHWDTICIS